MTFFVKQASFDIDEPRRQLALENSRIKRADTSVSSRTTWTGRKKTIRLIQRCISRIVWECNTLKIFPLELFSNYKASTDRHSLCFIQISKCSLVESVQVRGQNSKNVIAFLYACLNNNAGVILSSRIISVILIQNNSRVLIGKSCG